jgi:predicted TIM-barrel fold metal-dependent hydrolase
MAELPFVDTHVHFWDFAHPELRYDWLRTEGDHPLLGNMEPIKMPLYGADEFISETRFQNVAKAIHVQAAIGSADPVQETRWLQAYADRTGFPHGIVAHTSLAAADAEETLDRHLEFANVRGVRDYAQGDFLLDAGWRRGYATLAARELVCCIHVTWEALAHARQLAADFPDVVLCVEHTGFPMRRDDDYFASWREGMRTVAAAENVVAKISGLGMFDRRWTVESWRPWVLETIELFGPDRCCFATNWPVDRLYSSYGDVVEAYATLIADFALDEQRALFSGNAERIFRI